MPVAGGPRLREEMGPVFQLYCPACKRVRDPPSFSAKKTRACQTCGHENIIICFTGVNHPPGYVKRTKQRRTIAIVFLLVAMLVPMIIEVAVWGSKGIWPFPKDPTPAELQVQRDAMVTLLVTGVLGG